ncbi:MAG TPA: hypothetical protein VFE15_08280 [Marmoricola sp.]|nr:hypothetical protein [Marmoricola sp.]
MNAAVIVVIVSSSIVDREPLMALLVSVLIGVAGTRDRPDLRRRYAAAQLALVACVLIAESAQSSGLLVATGMVAIMAACGIIIAIVQPSTIRSVLAMSCVFVAGVVAYAWATGVL